MSPRGLVDVFIFERVLALLKLLDKSVGGSCDIFNELFLLLSIVFVRRFVEKCGPRFFLFVGE